jgi:hypothetical protein
LCLTLLLQLLLSDLARASLLLLLLLVLPALLLVREVNDFSSLPLASHSCSCNFICSCNSNPAVLF